MASKYISSLKLPSKKVLIFFGSCTGISLLIYRDNRLSKEAKISLVNKVSHLASEPLSAHELPRKVTVYLAPPLGDGVYKTKIHFREYVLPVLNAAALEYDIVEGTKPGQLRSKVREAIREKRKQELSPSSSQSSLSSTADSDQPFKTITPSKPIDGGTIVIGRISWIEYLQGLNEGCIASLEDPPSKQTKSDLNSEQADQQSDKSDTSQDKNNSNEESEPEFIISEKDFSVPELDSIGYIHFYNRIGWKNFPLRLYYALNSYKEFDLAGEDAVKVALGNTRQFKKDDLNLGKDEENFFKGTLNEPTTIDERIIAKLSMYT
ncbi:hypothetical protein RhiirA5_484257 [Rhizophagus irregularis]|uniref:Mitochondrial import inner membrane translocase subunit TIM54 n=4 Tax=Rhizophagus irregularis TaxID=588596 RepID=A0A2I1E2U1_9GLOM|nr:hypothetical protein GLOIN_2v1781496 [Rhizophagus irregularis DAOM 181602=DAOM 197198]EXX55116.1 Tim54p [Rhizophagus irregularis DAOM 197198w]PKC15607.1 hypothetical protein RhiirA5_484257 [Rhizophagus irregularis]PKC72350.1 hypothetical protein RhiirA1_492575 [Rhizophagus irregularis]PKY16438.1 hypothetical protein RhiirB3_481845 [Rhizophagus irregularis]PKY54225.1 hypothetical protein RhiirA4_500910 [Rhizophagus irregularis]|eukprot:XP_025172505.1 hypothetical protein GLOIN_2v1781496 [Rhizophagus irregularis DAOM 181602=DAOM 197198]